MSRIGNMLGTVLVVVLLATMSGCGGSSSDNTNTSGRLTGSGK